MERLEAPRESDSDSAEGILSSGSTLAVDPSTTLESGDAISHADDGDFVGPIDPGETLDSGDEAGGELATEPGRIESDDVDVDLDAGIAGGGGTDFGGDAGGNADAG